MTSSGTPSSRPPQEWVWRRALHEGAPIPHTPPDEEVRRGLALPRTLVPAPEGLDQPAVFDPALLQFSYAYRAGDPRFASEDEARAWFLARRTALDLVLSAVAGTPLGGRLVLRGSALMATWFGAAAREPGDLDYVAPADWECEGPEARELFGQLAQAARRTAEALPDGGVRIDADGAVTEDIWTYDRVPGRRLLLPWTAPGTAGGTVQIDVVYHELLAVPAVRTPLRPLGAGPGTVVDAVTPELSLAWKIMWLISDIHPQGKDLYDAVLLAERATPSFDVLQRAFVLAGDELLRPGGRWWLAELAECADVGWEHFQGEYPQVTGEVDEYVGRLRAVLEPLADRAEHEARADAYDRWAHWLAPLVEHVRATAPHAPAAAVGRRLSASGRWGFVATVVVVREVVGRGTTTLEEACAAVLRDEENWAYLRGRPDLSSRFLEELR
ncbi:nucleotidyl transferase AbiEii/AbiGii toxin family protein [Streptomyces sp. VRA16 Mangrove soil]|uniref:nucleotidyl transferase AbiEii/AbiGii toxin family protein n=1 Tax=Streptomyces sp. VRA16 Mangrove soil TaxID=2817434 RepID=UPI001A9F53CC|nr:nucleotidyl transferase AbiEii/AbiGii toxin family protein [Streptomyces sp. VRA16 Mangrove soil]MBO1334588.1 nucleotidyl transferase AbiEii/AbiGii toxin family protein [Streptomyces sp. VRA16 Mangrove soil]